MLDVEKIEIDKIKFSSPRDAYGRTLLQLGKENNKIIVLDADLSKSTKTSYFHKEFPERFFDMGISEADMVTTAAGISTCGFTVFASTFAMFLSGRAWEQVRNTVAYGNFNVKLVATHAGISVGPDGASHQAIEDIAIMSAIPNMTVVAPSDSESTIQLIKQAAEHFGPYYFRLPRIKTADIYNNSDTITIGKSNLIIEGDDITIISYGLMLYRSIIASTILRKRGINARVIDMSTIKPFDKNEVIKASNETKGLIIAEEHSIFGGLGSTVATYLSDINPTLIKFVSLNDEFGRSGEPEELLDHFELTSDKIVSKALEILND